jgi:hypothetical protein
MRAFLLAVMIPAFASAAGNRPAPAPPVLTHEQRCQFFELGAMSMINFRDQGRQYPYGMRMAALQFSLYNLLPGGGTGEGPGLEAEYKLGVR